MSLGSRPGVRDHPRGCGEKAPGREGSSPRVRGEAAFCASLVKGTGIIPAGAGRSGVLRVAGQGDGDHPRGCGEKRLPPRLGPGQRGSSPRVRGEVSLERKLSMGSGIIPAGAGRSELGEEVEHGVRDHPRGCGKKGGCGAVDGRLLGSSPRVRGEVVVGLGEGLALGIIPAGAGRSSPRLPS